MAVGTFLSIVAYGAKKGAGGGGGCMEQGGEQKFAQSPNTKEYCNHETLPETEIYDIDVGGRLRKCKELETVSALG